MIWNAPARLEYMRLSRELGYHVRIREQPSDELATNYHRALDAYRRFLDMNQMKMPTPDFPYRPKHVRTWKYLEDGELNLSWKYRYAE